jgi:protocatechuate 3,4-dioxygenase beta subunit
MDVKPSAQPVQSFRYSIELYSADQQNPSQRLDIAYRSDDGILRIPPPFPPFGRICVWVDADDPEKGYRHGYRSFSYRIATENRTGPTTIQLELGIVLTGKVLDAETGKPIADAEVAPLKWGHHDSWADWDESAKTDREGKYRVIAGGAQGIAARHPEYRGAELDNKPWGFSAGLNRKNSRWSDPLFGKWNELTGDKREEKEEHEEEEVGPDGFVFRLHPLMRLCGQVVDTDGKPIPKVSVTGCDRDSDANGRFCVRVTQEEWNQREKHEISLYARNHRSLDVPLKDFSVDRETVVILEREPLIRGQILDEDGKPLEDCTVELRCDSENVLPGMFTVVPLQKQGKWETCIDERDQSFTLRVSVKGFVRYVRQYTLEEVTSGPIIAKLAEGRRLTGSLVAKAPLDEKSTPVVLLSSTANEELWQQAQVQVDGSFAFSGLGDGTYTLRLHPAICGQHRGGSMKGVAAYSTFGFASPNRPWERSITILGSNPQLDPINLHGAGLLPGRVTGVAYNPAAANKPFANAFGYICSGEYNYDSVGGCYYLVKSMTDAEGRFQIDACPPGEYVLRFSENSDGYGLYDPSVWIRVTPERTMDLRLFSPEAVHRLAINFVVGDGSSRDLHAGTALDERVIAKHADPKTGELPFIDDSSERHRATASVILCELQPLDKTTTHWPIHRESFEFSPRNLLKGNLRDIVVPNLTPGRWRLTLTARYSSVYSISETLLTRDFAFSEGMAPLQIKLPASSLSGTYENPIRGLWNRTTIEVIPQVPGLPTRTLHGLETFRFVGLAPGKYSLRFQDEGCQTKRVDDVIVRKGETSWLEQVTLKPTTPTTETMSGAPEMSN